MRRSVHGRVQQALRKLRRLLRWGKPEWPDDPYAWVAAPKKPRPPHRSAAVAEKPEP